jgi:hypothetical protein
MATTFKKINPSNDVTSTRNLIYEAIPLTGAIVSGTYADNNIKNFSHGMFQAVYDYPFLSSSANHVFDLSVGYSSESGLSSSTSIDNAKKINMYNEMAQVLAGFDQNSVIRRFDEDGDFVGTATKINEAYFINLTRLLTKDEIKKGSVSLQLGTRAAYATPFGVGDVDSGDLIKLVDKSGSSGYKINSPAGEYGVLFATGSNLAAAGVDVTGYVPAGLVYYQAGIAVVSASVFGSLLTAPVVMDADGHNVTQNLTASGISGNCDTFRHRMYNLSLNNTTELNSTIYFCRVNHDDFNYSSNPTYLSSSQLVVKSSAQDNPVSYITTVGLYSADNELLAVAKLSEPLKNDPTTEVTIRVRLDY